MKQTSKFIKCICLLLSMALIMACFSGCGIQRGEYAGDLFKLYTSEKEAAFRIIRSNNSSHELIDLGVKLREKVSENLGLDIEYKPDTMKQKEGIYDLCIGVTNRPSSKKIYNDIVKARKNHDLDYTIQVVDNCIHLIGGSDDGVALAVDYFIENYCKNVDGFLSTEYCKKFVMDVNGLEIDGGLKIDKFNIVYPKYNSSYLTTLEMQKLQKAIKQVTGTEPKILKDHEKESKYEIVVGNTNRKDVSKITDYNTYEIKLVGNKIYLNGGSNYATAMAVTEFTNLVKNGGKITKKAIVGDYSKTIESYDKSKYYTSTVTDHFDGDKLDEKLWDVRTDGPLPTWNGEEGRYADIPGAVIVKDGVCKISGSRDIKNGKTYFSGLTTQKKQMFRYGLMEMSMILPNVNGIYSSYWFVGSSSTGVYPEFDIFEQYCCDDPEFKVTVIKNPGGLNVNQAFADILSWEDTVYKLTDGSDFNDTWHTASMLWDEDTVTFAYDGEVLYSIRHEGQTNGYEEMCDQYTFGMVGVLPNYYSPMITNINWSMFSPLDDFNADLSNYPMLIEYWQVMQLEGRGGHKVRG